jgi:hypothetical protein
MARSKSAKWDGSRKSEIGLVCAAPRGCSPIIAAIRLSPMELMLLPDSMALHILLIHGVWTKTVR